MQRNAGNCELIQCILAPDKVPHPLLQVANPRASGTIPQLRQNGFLHDQHRLQQQQGRRPSSQQQPLRVRPRPSARR